MHVCGATWGHGRAAGGCEGVAGGTRHAPAGSAEHQRPHLRGRCCPAASAAPAATPSPTPPERAAQRGCQGQRLAAVREGAEASTPQRWAQPPRLSFPAARAGPAPPPTHLRQAVARQLPKEACPDSGARLWVQHGRLYRAPAPRSGSEQVGTLPAGSQQSSPTVQHARAPRPTPLCSQAHTSAVRRGRARPTPPGSTCIGSGMSRRAGAWVHGRTPQHAESSFLPSHAQPRTHGTRSCRHPAWSAPAAACSRGWR